MESREWRNRMRAIGNVLAIVGLIAYIIYELPRLNPRDPGWRSILVFIALITLKVLIAQAFYNRDFFQADHSDPKAERRYLDTLRRDGKPFALYLRNFALETGWSGLVVTNKTAVEADFVQPTLNYWPVPKNILEQSIVGEFAPYVPVFALVNRDDMAVGSARKILANSQMGWQAEVQELAREAHLIVTVFKGSSEGMVEELRFLMKEGLEERLVLFVFPGEKAKLNDVVPGLLERTQWVGDILPMQSGSDRLSSAVMPAGLREHLASLQRTGPGD